MPALTPWPTRYGLFLLALDAVACRPKVSGAQCNELLDRYSALVVRERLPDASVEQFKAEQDHEKTDARGDDAFKNCSSEVSRAEFNCAVTATNADAMKKCLE